MTGSSFSTVPSSTSLGVVRVQVNDALDTQQYTITGSTTSDVVITGGTWRAARNGLYHWLRTLGAAQLGPGDRWRVTPTRTDLRQNLNIDATPLMSTLHWTPQGSGIGWPTASGFSDHYDAWQQLFDWNSRPMGHHTGANGAVAAERQAFGGHMDGTAHDANTAAFNADATHYAVPGRAWQASHNYRVGDLCSNGGRTYQCTQLGTSAGAGGPSGTGTAIADDSVLWNYYTDSGLTTDRYTNIGYFNMTHEGTGSGTTYSGTSGVVGIYSDWTIERVDASDAEMSDQYEDLQFTLSCAVADGADPCRCVKCLDLLRNVYSLSTDASATDLSLWRNGRIAALVRAARPSANVKILDYAYDAQSAPPTDGWPVSPHLFILHAQYRYQLDAIPPTMRLEQWVARRDLDGFGLGVYDYWALPAHGLADARESYVKLWGRVREWLGHGVDAYVGESTVSGGAVGLQWWGACRLAWDGADLTDEELVAEYCTAFGAGASAMQTFLERLFGTEWPTFSSNAYELPFVFRDLAAVDALVSGDADVRPRVAAWMAYVLYLHYKRVWDTLPGGSSQATVEAACDALLKHTWRTRLTYMVDVTHVHLNVAADARTSAGFQTQWTIGDSTTWAAWHATNGITDWTDDQIRTLFESVRATQSVPTPAAYTAPTSALVGPYTPAGTSLNTENFVNSDEGPPAGHEFIFEVKSGFTGDFAVELTASAQPSKARIKLYNAVTGALLDTFEDDVPYYFDGLTSDQFLTKTYDLGALAVGFYRVLVLFAGSVRVQHQKRMPIVRVGEYNRICWQAVPTGLPDFYGQFFFVPKGVTSFHIQVSAAVNVRDESGTAATLTALGGGIYRVTVPAGHDQEVWSIGGDVGGYAGWLIDLPNWFAPTHDQIVVPQNLWTE